MQRETQQEPFVEYLEKHREDRAMLAELRRGLGREPGEAPGMFPYIMPFVPETAYGHYEANLYLLASLFALHPVSARSGNIGTHLKALADSADNHEATTRRFVQLLNQHRDALVTPLRQHISLLKAHDVGVNWHRLLYDLRYWDHPERFVQKQWAAAYWHEASKNHS
jgi:CRISPR system Cascade subunit CasB